MQYVKKRNGKKRVRIFALGIDSAVNSWLLNELASLTGGRTVFITPDERVDAKTAQLFNSIHTPLLENVSVRFDGITVSDLHPAPPVAVFWGEPLILSGRFTSGTKKAKVSLEGKSGAKPFEYESKVLLEPGKADSAIKYCWAKRHIAHLETAYNDSGDMENDKARKALLDFALKYQLACALTSLLGVDERPSTEGGKACQTRVVPVMLPYAWDWTSQLIAMRWIGAFPMRMCEWHPPVTDHPKEIGPVISKYPCRPKLSQHPSVNFCLGSIDHDACTGSGPMYTSEEDDLLEAAIELAAEQRADGAWGNVRLRRKTRIISTSLAVMALASCGHDVDSPELGIILQKAKAWLLSQEPKDPFLRSIVEAALGAISGTPALYDEWADKLPGRLARVARKALKLWSEACA